MLCNFFFYFFGKEAYHEKFTGNQLPTLPTLRKTPAFKAETKKKTFA